MKKYLNLFAPALGAILLMSVLSSGVVLGCKSTPQTITYNSIYSVEKATTGAYDGYVDAVISGSVSTNGLPRVSRAYNKFQASVAVALDACQFNTNALAPDSLLTESGDVINLINQLK